ncbi:FMN-binding negative transcriptional regulator [Novosphingobium tardum]|uniref:FMN-binding negative transcriptional regulator n=1 Tax=Novosphingobium tardum TaxID=1538021 RepID=A0ABV8RMH2_9SPHN
MHPNPVFRENDRGLCHTLVDQVGFGMVFAAVPDGPRVAHAPLLRHGDDRLRFHLARGNALSRHLDGQETLALVNGPDGYVSPRWYSDQRQVPTWNYVALEMQGPVRRLARDDLVSLLDDLSDRNEARVAQGSPWTRSKMDGNAFARLLDGIVGFELEITAWRPTFKLSQNKPVEERERVAAGLEAAGSAGIAALMRRTEA